MVISVDFEFYIKEGLIVADQLISKVKNQLKKSLLQKNSTSAELQRAQCKIETGIERRQELVEEVCAREAKKRTRH